MDRGNAAFPPAPPGHGQPPASMCAAGAEQSAGRSDVAAPLAALCRPAPAPEAGSPAGAPSEASAPPAACRLPGCCGAGGTSPLRQAASRRPPQPGGRTDSPSCPQRLRESVHRHLQRRRGPDQQHQVLRRLHGPAGRRHQLPGLPPALGLSRTGPGAGGARDVGRHSSDHTGHSQVPATARGSVGPNRTTCRGVRAPCPRQGPSPSSRSSAKSCPSGKRPFLPPSAPTPTSPTESLCSTVCWETTRVRTRTHAHARTRAPRGGAAQAPVTARPSQSAKRPWAVVFSVRAACPPPCRVGPWLWRNGDIWFLERPRGQSEGWLAGPKGRSG